jgi:ribonuclease J
MNNNNSNQGRRSYGRPSGSNSSNQSSNNNRRFNNNRRPAENGPRSNARAGDRPHYMNKKPRLQRVSTAGLVGGNLANPDMNPALFNGVKIGTKSPSVFPEGLPVKIIPMGGLNEVGMNMTALECGDDIVIIDTGFAFGGGELFPGVDYIIPDTGYLEANKHKIRGLIYTHAHLDHIGAAPYVIPKLGDIPIFGMPLTLALLKNRLIEFALEDKITAKIIDLDKPLRLGVFTFQFFRLNHSLPDVVGLGIDTPMGRIVYCTDWKFDQTPYDGKLSEYGKIAKLGDEGVRVLMTDSLGIMQPGYSISEREIAKTVLKIFGEAEGRVIFTTFSTTIARIQHVINACEANGRKLAVVGRSMITNFKTCFDLGYIKVPKDILMEIRDMGDMPANRVCILSTGSQGEENAALSRMARDEHQTIKLQAGDSVVFSNSQIPGNEDAIQNLKARLSRKGVNTYNPKEFDLHVTGHACHEDLKMMVAFTRPDYILPIHGDHHMLKRLAELGISMGIEPEHCIISENGRITELQSEKIVLTEEVITDSYLLVDGTSVGVVSEAVLQERRTMATDGSVIVVMLVNKQKKLVGGPEIISRGFVYMKNSRDFLNEIQEELRAKFDYIKIDPESQSYFSDLRNAIKKETSDFIYNKMEKTPMVIPIVVQI